MARINFNPSTFSRHVAKSADLILRNRYFEKNPSLTDDGQTLVARPGLRKLTTVGEGPIRGLIFETGSFNSDLFICSGNELYRMNQNLSLTFLTNEISGERSNINMAITAKINSINEFLFIADGESLKVYEEGVGVIPVPLPNTVGAIDVAVINSFVVVIPVQAGEFTGRFYWIEPGEKTVNPLNFATAERAADGINGVQVFGDQFWLPGLKTTETWFFTGDAASPVSRVRGVVYDRGSWENTSKAIHEQMINVDNNGGVFVIRGNSPQRVSNPAIEEEIRKAISYQKFMEG